MTAAILLVVAGFLFVVAEVFFPSLGMFGLLAAGALVAGDWLAYQVSPAFMWVLVGVEVVGVPLVLRTAFTVLPHLPFGRGMILAQAPPDPSAAIERAEHLLGRRGTALTDLRPSGTALLGDERRTVVSEMAVVPSGTPVVVVSVEGYRIVVRPESPAPATPPA